MSTKMNKCRSYALLSLFSSWIIACDQQPSFNENTTTADGYMDANASMDPNISGENSSDSVLNKESPLENSSDVYEQITANNENGALVNNDVQNSNDSIQNTNNENNGTNSNPNNEQISKENPQNPPDQIYPKPGPVVDENPTPSPKMDPFSSLLWFWQCSTNPEPIPSPASSLDMVIVGPGEHKLDPSRINHLPVTIRGQLCKPKQMPRDIVFVIDVSGSMTNSEAHDPRYGNSCGRLTALEAVLSRISLDGNSRFGLVTFNSAVQPGTKGLYSNYQDLFNSAISASHTSHIADVVCAGNGNTNYDAALLGAQNIFTQNGDPQASKEIYFISDGEPNPSQYNGVTKATALKNQGVLIATIMLIGNDIPMKKLSSIDPTDPSGKKLLHAKVSDAGFLADILTEISSNDLDRGELKYRVIGNTSWTSVSLMTVKKDYYFELPPFTLDESIAKVGVEFALDYYDKKGNHFGDQGSIIWSP